MRNSIPNREGATLKKFSVILTLLTVVLSAAFAKTANAAETKFMTFLNDHTEPSFTIEIPDIFDSIRIPGGGTSLEFGGKGGEYVLMINDFRNNGSEADADNFYHQNDAGTVLSEILARFYGELVPGSAKSGTDFYTYEEITDGPRNDIEYVRHDYGIRDPETKAVFSYTLVYPKDEETRFKEIIAHLEKSFKLK
jgi:hypothetical protein